MKSIFDHLDPLMEFNPPFIDVTYHREDFDYRMTENGFYEKIAIRKRPGTVGICTSIKHRYGVDTVPHLLCGGFTVDETEDVLIDLNFLNIHNVLALRGDKRKFEPTFVPKEGGHHYAVDLVKQIQNMNEGHYIDQNISNGTATDFCIGIAGYPEKHFEAPNLASDLQYTKQKVDAGADYIVTQLFYDNQKYFDYVDACRDIGIHVPIVPGLKPITKKYQLNSIPRFFNVDIPEDLIAAIQKADTPKKVEEIGTEWCIAQSKELKERGVPCIHYYTLGQSDIFKKIAENVF